MGVGDISKVDTWREPDGVRVDKLIMRPSQDKYAQGCGSQTNQLVRHVRGNVFEPRSHIRPRSCNSHCSGAWSKTQAVHTRFTACPCVQAHR